MNTELTNEAAMSAIVLLRQIGRDFTNPERAEKFNQAAARLADAINAPDSGDCIPDSIRRSLAGIASECQDQAAAGAIDALLERHGVRQMWRIGCAESASNNEIEGALCARLGPAEDSADPEGYARAAMYHKLGWRDAEAHIAAVEWHMSRRAAPAVKESLTTPTT